MLLLDVPITRSNYISSFACFPEAEPSLAPYDGTIGGGLHDKRLSSLNCCIGFFTFSSMVVFLLLHFDH